MTRCLFNDWFRPIVYNYVWLIDLSIITYEKKSNINYLISETGIQRAPKTEISIGPFLQNPYCSHWFAHKDVSTGWFYDVFLICIFWNLVRPLGTRTSESEWASYHFITIIADTRDTTDRIKLGGERKIRVSFFFSLFVKEKTRLARERSDRFFVWAAAQNTRVPLRFRLQRRVIITTISDSRVALIRLGALFYAHKRDGGGEGERKDKKINKYRRPVRRAGYTL